jgi:hypothetical protein
MHIPHGSDWLSIREAGMNAAQRKPHPVTPLAQMHMSTHRKVMKLSLG